MEVTIPEEIKTKLLEVYAAAKKDQKTTEHLIDQNGNDDNGCPYPDASYTAGYLNGVEYVLEVLQII